MGTKQTRDNSAWLSAVEFAARLSWHPSYTTVWRWMNAGLVETKNVSLGQRNVRVIPVAEVARIEQVFKSKSFLTKQANIE